MKPPWLSIAYPLHSLFLFLPSSLLPHNKSLEVKQDSLRCHFHCWTQTCLSYPPLTPKLTAVLGVRRFFGNTLTSHQSDLDQCFGLRGIKSVGSAEYVTFPSKLFVSTQIRKSTSTDIQDKQKWYFQGSGWEHFKDTTKCFCYLLLNRAENLQNFQFKSKGNAKGGRIKTKYLCLPKTLALCSTMVVLSEVFRL